MIKSIEEIRKIVNKIEPEYPPFLLKNSRELAFRYMMFDNTADLMHLRQQSMLASAIDEFHRCGDVEYLRGF